MANTEELSLRMTPDVRRKLTLAAKAEGRPISAFVRESALSRAHELLPDRRHFGLGAEQWEAFMAALEATPRELPMIKRLMRDPGVFERNNHQNE